MQTLSVTHPSQSFQHTANSNVSLPSRSGSGSPGAQRAPTLARQQRAVPAQHGLERGASAARPRARSPCGARVRAERVRLPLHAAHHELTPTSTCGGGREAAPQEERDGGGHEARALRARGGDEEADLGAEVRGVSVGQADESYKWGLLL